MQKHTKIYMDYFGLSEGDYIGSELTNSPSGPIHHIKFRSQEKNDSIENLMALTPEEHSRAHFVGNKKRWIKAEYLQDKHNQFKKRYDENNPTTICSHNKIRNKKR